MILSKDSYLHVQRITSQIGDSYIFKLVTFSELHPHKVDGIKI